MKISFRKIIYSISFLFLKNPLPICTHVSIEKCLQVYTTNSTMVTSGGEDSFGVEMNSEDLLSFI